MAFKEHLPPNCPPSEAKDQDWGAVYRLVKHDAVSEEDFLSHAALGTVPRSAKDLCRFSSCSLFTSKDTALGKLPTMKKKFKYLASLAIPLGSGKSKQSGHHIDMWFFKRCDPCCLVQDIEPTGV